MGCLVGEVKNCHGVDRVAHVAGFKVEVWTGRTAGVSGEADGLSGFHILVFFDKDFREVAIDGFEIVIVSGDDIIAIPAGFVVGDSDSAIESGADCVTDVYVKVDAFVHAAETFAVAVGRSQIAGVGHRKVSDIDFGALRHLDTGIAVDSTAAPAHFVEVFFGFDFFFIVEVVDRASASTPIADKNMNAEEIAKALRRENCIGLL